MPLLITGGSGFLGIHLARQLVCNGHQVVLGDINPKAKIPEDLQGKVAYVHCDISYPLSFIEAVKSHEISSIIHLAVAIRTIAELNPQAAFQANIVGLHNLLEIACICQLEKVIFPSSHSVFPPGTQVVESNTRPSQWANTYGIAKIFGEQMGLYYHKTHGLDFRAMRFCSINGPGRPYIGGTSFVSLMFRELARAGRFVIPTKESTLFHSIYIKDAVRCLMELHDAAAENILSRVYNMAGIPMVMKDLAAEIKKHLPEANLNFEPDADLLREFESWPHTIDDSAAHEEWGWKLEYNLEKMVADYIKEETNAV